MKKQTPESTAAAPADGLQNWSADQVLAAWQTYRRGQGKAGLSEGSARRYMPILRLWMEYLATLPTPVHWWAADAGMLVDFVGQRPARSTTRHKKPSPVTAARYWRIVHLFYAALPAVALSLKLEPPVEHPLALNEPPETANSELAKSTALPRQLLEKVAARLQAPLEVPENSPQPWTHVRNRAILALLLATGATVRDIAQLRLGHIGKLKHGRISVHLGADAKPPAARARVLVVDGDAARWVKAWLDERKGVKLRSDVLFFSVKGRQPLTAVHLWHTVSHEVELALQDEEHLPYQIGPNLLRNSVLLSWLEARRPLEDVMRDAGLAEARLLKRLIEHASAGAQRVALADPLLQDSAAAAGDAPALPNLDTP